MTGRRADCSALTTSWSMPLLGGSGVRKAIGERGRHRPGDGGAPWETGDAGDMGGASQDSPK